MCPSKQVHESVQAGKLTASKLLSLHVGGRVCPREVIDRCDHAETYKEKVWREVSSQALPYLEAAESGSVPALYVRMCPVSAQCCISLSSLGEMRISNLLCRFV